MAKTMTSQQFADKWATRLGAAGQAFADGVNGVSSSPMEAAAANPQKFLNGIQDAVNSGKWAANLRSVSLADWKKAMLEKGQGRISSGATAAKSKMVSFFNQFGPVLAQNVATVRGMPSDTKEQRIQRAVAMMQLNSNFKYQK